MNYICDNCKKEFALSRWRNRNKHFFCSVECDREFKRKERLKNGGKIPY